MVRTSSGRGGEDGQQPAASEDRGVLAQHDLDCDTDGAGYDVTQDRINKPDVPVTATWVPLRGRDQPYRGGNRWQRESSGTAQSHKQSQTKDDELPGPFFSSSAFFYIFLYPTWTRWLGLSVVTSLAAGVLSITLFVSWIVIRFQLFLSVFAISAMTMLNLALISYIIACFVEVIEETAAGEERLQQLVDMSWWDILPRFLRVAGAAGVAGGITWMLTVPLKHAELVDAPILRIIQVVWWLQLFPILLITNLVDNTIIPFQSLIGTLRRLAARVGCFAAFQAFALLLSASVLLALDTLHTYHWAASLAAAGPICTAWTLYYGHWIGRLGRQLADVE